ncbi:hypothetical protein JAAARDRAFT_60555 [Jaapia argillacea MUCL 33604]|uniref:Rhodopsin domain-containing protein n=1 Tax=Jaapia argillacea MUCL 33604 TaxID=933084 RepID=A0A067PW40_9AGAM|nr:hypothetical protein JAAARDRAFT_60555 [Jaapia argillacea MUCL 33604]
MALDLDDPLVQIKITESVCGFVAICMTVARLWIRRGRYWWDDGWAFFSLLCLFVQIGAVFMHVETPSDLSQINRVAAYYLMAMSFYAVIWSARLAILFSIIRLDPNPVMRSRLKWVAGVFIACIFFFFAQLMWVCEPEPKWKNAASPQCELNKQVAICQLVSDILSDILLIVLPLRLIRGMRDKSLRRRLMIIFSTSIVTTIVSLVHAAYIITVGGIKVVISALVEDCMSLTVANLPVAATALFKVFGLYGASDDSDDSTYPDHHGSGEQRRGEGPRFKSTTIGFRSYFSGIFTRAGRTTYGGATTRISVPVVGGLSSVGTGTMGTDGTNTTMSDFGVKSKIPGIGVRTVDFVLEEREEESEEREVEGKRVDLMEAEENADIREIEQEDSDQGRVVHLPTFSWEGHGDRKGDLEKNVGSSLQGTGSRGAGSD